MRGSSPLHGQACQLLLGGWPQLESSAGQGGRSGHGLGPHLAYLRPPVDLQDSEGAADLLFPLCAPEVASARGRWEFAQS